MIACIRDGCQHNKCNLGIDYRSQDTVSRCRWIRGQLDSPQLNMEKSKVCLDTHGRVRSMNRKGGTPESKILPEAKRRRQNGYLIQKTEPIDGHDLMIKTSQDNSKHGNQKQ